MACLRLLLQEAGEALPGYERVCRRRCWSASAASGTPPSPAPGPAGSAAWSGGTPATHFKENLCLDQPAHLAHLNKYYLAHTFRRESGVSPINYLISRRIEESRFLFRETDPLSLIARILGFSSLSCFSRCFRRMEGVSPLEYGRKNR